MGKSYKELKAEKAKLEKQLSAAKKKERAEALKTVRALCQEFDITAGMLRGSLAKGRERKKEVAKAG